MSDRSNFDNIATCGECEAMLTDWVDGTLSAQEQAAFEVHLATCTTCSQMGADAQRGAAWLQMLRTPRPEPSDALLERILLETSGMAPHGQQEIHPFVPAALVSTLPEGLHAEGSLQRRGVVLPFRSRVATPNPMRALRSTFLQPRLALTAAMAFFSIALTLNLTGIHPGEMRASDLRPSNLSRGLHGLQGQAVRYYDNLPVVYELESRLNDFKRANDDNRADVYHPEEGLGNAGDRENTAPRNDSAPEPKANPEPKGNMDAPTQGAPSGSEPAQPHAERPQPGPGTSRRETPGAVDHRSSLVHVTASETRQVVGGGVA